MSIEIHNLIYYFTTRRRIPGKEFKTQFSVYSALTRHFSKIPRQQSKLSRLLAIQLFIEEKNQVYNE